jgi:hypothetical protein
LEDAEEREEEEEEYREEVASMLVGLHWTGNASTRAKTTANQCS